MEVAAERAFAQLKSQLDALSYNEPVGLESAPLVQRLLSDLVLTTENYELMRDRAEGAQRAAATLKGESAPGRKEQSRLVRENNELQLELLRMRESLSRSKYEAEGAIAREHGRTEDLRFLVDKQRRVIAEKESELSNLQNRFRITMSKFGVADVDDEFFADEDRATDRGGMAGELVDALHSVQEQLDEQRAIASRHATEVRSLQAALSTRDAEISRLHHGSSPSSPPGDGGDDKHAAQSRLIVQLTEHVDFLTAELASRDTTAGSALGLSLGMDSAPGAPGHGYLAMDAASRVQAMEMEVTRLATRLESTAAAKARSDATVKALRDEVSALQSLVSEAQAAARIAAAEAGTAAEANAKTAEALGHAGHGPGRARAELSAALRELSRLQTEHARMAAAAEAVAVDRERYSREIHRLEQALAGASGRVQQSVAAATLAESTAQSARDEMSGLKAEAAALRGELAASANTIGALEAAKHEAARRIDQAEAELASLRPLVNRQAADNDGLRATSTDLRLQLSESVATLRATTASKEQLLYEMRAAEGSAARTGATAHALEAEVSGLKRECDALGSALDAARTISHECSTALESARAQQVEDAARMEALRKELDDTAARLAAQTRIAASASEQIARLQAVAGLSNEVQALRVEVTAWRQRATAAEIATDSAGRIRDRAEARASELGRDLEASRSSLERSNLAVAASEKKAGELGMQAEEVEARLRAAEGERAHVTELLGQAQSRLARVESESESARLDLVRAREELLAARTDTAAALGRVHEAERAALAAQAETESYAASAAGADSARTEAVRARDALAVDLAGVVRRAQDCIGEAGLARQRLSAAEADAAGAKATAARELARSAELQAQVDQMRTLFTQLDRTRESATVQLSEAVGRIEGLEAKLKAQAGARDATRAELAERDAEISRLRSAVAQLGDDETGLNQELDAHAQRLADLSRTNEALTQAAAAARADAESCRGDVARLTATIAARERDCGALRKSLDDYKVSMADAIAARDAARAEFAAAAEDVGTMTRENQVLAAHMSAIRREASDARAACEGVRGSLGQAEAAVAHLHAERGELMRLYAAVCEERQALLAELGAAEAHKADLEAAYAEAVQGAGALQAALEEEGRAREAGEASCASMEMQLAGLSTELQAARQELYNVDAANAGLAREAGVARTTTEGQAMAVEKLRRQAMEADARAQAAHEAAGAAAGERAASHAITAALTCRQAELEVSLSSERTSRAEAEARMSALQAECESLRRQVTAVQAVAQGARSLARGEAATAVPAVDPMSLLLAEGGGLGLSSETATAAVVARLQNQNQRYAEEVTQLRRLLAAGAGSSTASPARPSPGRRY